MNLEIYTKDADPGGSHGRLRYISNSNSDKNIVIFIFTFEVHNDEILDTVGMTRNNEGVQVRILPR